MASKALAQASPGCAVTEAWSKATEEGDPHCCGGGGVVTALCA